MSNIGNITYNSHIHSHVPKRVPLFLHSRDSNNAETWYSQFTIDNFLLNAHKEDAMLNFHGVSFPNAVYPINEYNNQIYFAEDGGALIISTITSNNYTGTQFAAEIQTQMNADGGHTYAVTYDSQSKKISFVVTGGNCAFIAGENNAYEEMGVNDNLTSTFTSLTASNVVHIAGTQYVDVICDKAVHTYSSTHRTNVLIRVPLNVSFGNVVYFESEMPQHLELHTGSHLNSIQFELRDDKGNPYKLPSNCHVSFYMTIDHS